MLATARQMHEAALEQKIELPIFRSFMRCERSLATCLFTFPFFPRHSKKLFRSLLHELAEERLRHRPHHHSPRAIKRKMSNYLTTTRAVRTRSSKFVKMETALT